jgi:hypothetical protein
VAEVKRITEPQLADLLKGFRCAVRTEDGNLVNGVLHVPENVALHVFRSVSEPEPCPFHSGNGAAGDCNCELRKHLFRAPEPAPADVVDAHVCCEHVPGEGELAVLVTVKRELDRLCLKPEGTMRRVLAYLADLYGYVLADED